MKILKTILLFLCITTISNAQNDFKYSLKGIKKVTISTETKVLINTGTTNELLINCNSCSVNNNNESRGLKAIYANGNDDTGFGMSLERNGDVLIIKDLKSFMKRKKITFTLPKTIIISIECGNLGEAKIENFSSEVIVNSNIGQIDLINITGPITAFSNTGSINAIFITVNQNEPISIRSNTGNVDVSLPENTNADLVLKSNMGSVYSNFDIKIEEKDGMKTIGNNRIIKNKLNNGGVKITLSSNIGNVYLRKKE